MWGARTPKKSKSEKGENPTFWSRVLEGFSVGFGQRVGGRERTPPQYASQAAASIGGVGWAASGRGGEPS